MIAKTSFHALFLAERATVPIVNLPARLSMQYAADARPAQNILAIFVLKHQRAGALRDAFANFEVLRTCASFWSAVPHLRDRFSNNEGKQNGTRWNFPERLGN